MARPTITISIDTEEDDWGSYAESGAQTKNISLLPRLQDVFDRWGARPTYLVNRPPLVCSEAAKVLGALASRESVEIGAHCHPWNTPPTSERAESMLHNLPQDLVREKIREIQGRLRAELGVAATTFRAGRWGYGPVVSQALAHEGFETDASVTPFIDWSSMGGPDFSGAPNHPYRFHPERPFVPAPDGPMVELPTTIGFLRGDSRGAARLRTRLERTLAGPLKLVAVLDRAGLLARRWLSPETSSLEEMIQLATSETRHGRMVLDVTLHSCTLLPGATPFVRDRHDQEAFLARIDGFLRHCVEEGYDFRTLGAVARGVRGRDESTGRGPAVRSRRRALLVSYYFPPARAVGAQRPARLARLLPELGYDVDVVCATVDDDGSMGSSSTPFSSSDRRIWRVRTPFLFGRDPNRAPPEGDYWEKLYWKGRAYAEWLLFTRDWSVRWADAALRAVEPGIGRAGYDVVIADAPPRPAVVPFVRWAKGRGIPVVIDLRDVWTDPFEAGRWPIGWVLHPSQRRSVWNLRLRAEAIRLAHHLVVTSPEMAELMASELPDVSRARFTVIPNAYEHVDAPPTPRGGPRSRLRLVYTGSLAYGRDEQAESLVRAIASVRRQGGPEVEFTVAGPVESGLQGVALEEGVTDLVDVRGFLSRDEALELQRRADALVLLQPDDKVGTRVAIPAKLFEYMGRRRPILALVGPGPAARIVQEHELGIVASSLDIEDLGRALRELALCVQAEPFLRPPPTGYSERATAERFASVLDTVVAARG